MEFVCKQQIPAASSSSFSRSYFLLIFVHAGSLITLPILQVTDFSKYILPSLRIEDFFHLFSLSGTIFNSPKPEEREKVRGKVVLLLLPIPPLLLPLDHPLFKANQVECFCLEVCVRRAGRQQQQAMSCCVVQCCFRSQ